MSFPPSVPLYCTFLFKYRNHPAMQEKNTDTEHTVTYLSSEDDRYSEREREKERETVGEREREKE